MLKKPDFKLNHSRFGYLRAEFELIRITNYWYQINSFEGDIRGSNVKFVLLMFIDQRSSLISAMFKNYNNLIIQNYNYLF